MADSELTILVKTLSDTYGLDNVNKALLNLREQTANSGKEVEKHNESHREMHRLFRELNRLIPGLGHLLHGLFSPQAMGIGGAAAALGVLLELFSKLKEEAKEAAAAQMEHADAVAEAYGKAAANTEAFSRQIEDANEGVERVLKALQTAQADSKTKVDAVTGAINAQTAAIQKLFKAAETLELAQAKTDLQKAEIRARYGEKESKLPLAAEEARINETQNELKRAMAAQAGLVAEFNAANAGTTSQGRFERKTLAEQDLEKAQKQLKQAQEYIEKANAGSSIPFVGPGGRIDEMKKQQATAEANIRLANETLAALERQQAAAKERLVLADKELKENLKFVSDTSVALTTMKAKLRLDAATEGEVSAMTGMAGQISMANMIQKQLAKTAGGGFPTDFAGFMDAIEKLALLPSNMIKLKNSINSGMDEFNRAVKNMNDKVNDVTAQVKSLSNP